MAQSPQYSQGTSHASDFYTACQNGNLIAVNRYLKTMTATEVNKIEESNNSTALHAAAFNGHGDIVKRLLEIGANTHTRNGHGNTAEQEAHTQEIKDLFKHYH